MLWAIGWIVVQVSAIAFDIYQVEDKLKFHRRETTKDPCISFHVTSRGDLVLIGSPGDLMYVAIAIGKCYPVHFFNADGTKISFDVCTRYVHEPVENFASPPSFISSTCSGKYVCASKHIFKRIQEAPYWIEITNFEHADVLLLGSPVSDQFVFTKSISGVVFGSVEGHRTTFCETCVWQEDTSNEEGRIKTIRNDDWRMWATFNALGEDLYKPYSRPFVPIPWTKSVGHYDPSNVYYDMTSGAQIQIDLGGNPIISMEPFKKHIHQCVTAKTDAAVALKECFEETLPYQMIPFDVLRTIIFFLIEAESFRYQCHPTLQYHKHLWKTICETIK